MPQQPLSNRSAPEIAIWGLLVWAYRDQEVRFTGGTDEGQSIVMQMSGTAAAMLALNMGGTFRADHGGGGMFHRAFCHADALVVHAHVSALTKDESWLIVQTAEAGKPPDWDPDVPDVDRFAPYYDEFTGEIVEKFMRGKVNHRRIPGTWHCPIRAIPENARSESQKQAIREQARQRFTLWAFLLERLAVRLSATNSGLTRWKLSGYVPHSKPWLEGAKQGG